MKETQRTATMKSSFRRKVQFSAEQAEPSPVTQLAGEPSRQSTRGLKRSIYQQNQWLFSTAVPHLDVLLGGGVPLGTVLAIEEDALGYHADLLARYWQSDAVQHGHSLIYADAEGRAADTERWRAGLYAPLQSVDTEEEGKGEAKNDKEKMEIAWRYEHLPQKHSGASSPQKMFDITKQMPASLVNMAKVRLIDLTRATGCLYQHLLQELTPLIQAHQTKEEPMRLCIQGYASPYWHDAVENVALYRCLFRLRQLVAGTSISVLLTVVTQPYGANPRRLLDPPRHPMLTRLTHTVDAWLSLYSFVGTQYEHSPAYAEWSGSLKVVKTFRETDSAEWVYKVRRKRWTLERFVLPPEDDRTQGAQIQLGGKSEQEKPQSLQQQQYFQLQSSSTAPRQAPCGASSPSNHTKKQTRFASADPLDF